MTQEEFLRRRKERQRRIRKRRLFIFLVFLILSLIATGVILCLTVFFPIEKITVKGSEKYTPEQIEAASGIVLGDNLIRVNKQITLKQLKSKLPYVEDIRLKRNLPGDLKLTVTDATEALCYKTDDGFYIVSESDWVLKKVSKAPKNLYTVYGAKVSCKVGQSTIYKNEELKELSRQIAKELNAKKIKINSIDITSTVSINLKIEDRLEVSLGNANFLEEKIKYLSKMTENIDSKVQGKINLGMWTNNKQEGTFVEKKNKK